MNTTSTFCTHSGQRALLVAVLPLVIIALALSGCGSSKVPGEVPTFPVAGKLAFKGKPAVGAFVVLHPQSTDPNAPRPRATVQSDGTFALSSFREADGAPPGEYVLTAQWNKIVKSSNGDAGAGPNVLPAKYAKPSSSPVKVRIAEGSNDLQLIQLK